MTARSAIQDRALGVAGIAGGLALLSAFVVGIDTDLNPLRLVLYFAGSIAVVVALSGGWGSGPTAAHWGSPRRRSRRTPGRS